MYSVERTEYGIKLVLAGIINHDEAISWHREFIAELDKITSEFTVFVDMRELQPISHLVQVEFEKVQSAAWKSGMKGSVVIVNSQVVKRQFQEIAQQSGIFARERYIDASSTPDWAQAGLDWLENRIDPDTRKREPVPSL